MTMLSFRVADGEAAALQRWADSLGMDRSELMRDALRRRLVQLAAERDVDAWAERPLTDDEAALGHIADWGPAEEWSDWADATR